jgi:serine/threonine protein kinase
VGETLSKWTLERLIDVGGMAAVYEARHRNGNRVAIKLLHPEYAQHAEVKERFLREGYVANKVDHPGAVSVLDDDVTEDGGAFLVMELLDGESLEARLRRTETLTPLETFYAADQLLEVLAAAHAHGIVHRDIKPGNVFITRQGVIKLLDFGLARAREAGSLAGTRDGVILGTAAFMPPEQARGKMADIDARSDLWAVGALMFTSLTGQFVHLGDTPFERLVATSQKEARSLATVLPTLPSQLVAVVDKALAFDRARRFADATAMRQAVRSVLSQLARPIAPTIPKAIPKAPPAPVIIELDSTELQESIAKAVSLFEASIASIPIPISIPISVDVTSEAVSSTRVEDVGELPSVAVSMAEPKPPTK